MSSDFVETRLIFDVCKWVWMGNAKRNDEFPNIKQFWNIGLKTIFGPNKTVSQKTVGSSKTNFKSWKTSDLCSNPTCLMYSNRPPSLKADLSVSDDDGGNLSREDFVPPPTRVYKFFCVNDNFFDDEAKLRCAAPTSLLLRVWIFSSSHCGAVVANFVFFCVDNLMGSDRTPLPVLFFACVQ